jgi:AraC family transcriptional regulator of adaptative response / DNA-3-methyladenine glycosylase II
MSENGEFLRNARSILEGMMKDAMLDPNTCYRALQTRDARFDGRFFTAVRTTRIFCRPVCPAPTPKPENCQFFTSAAAAHEAGFRPCLRCRPELSPDLTAYITTASTVNRALQLIAEGALDDNPVETLATRLGVGDRHLRRLFDQHLGISPVAVAQTRRLLFAKQLIDQTTLPMTDIALAAGFKSLRRFNAAIHQTYQKAPRELRRLQVEETPDSVPEIQLKLSFVPPYDWAALVQFLMPRQTAGVEVVTPLCYARTIALEGHHGRVAVYPIQNSNSLLAKIRFPKVALLSQIVERLRRLFDLHVNIAEIAAHLQTDPRLNPIVAARPGLRIPGAWDGFELAVRTILGQQISVAAATTLAGRVVQNYGEPLQLEGNLDATALQFVFPQPKVLATADLTTLGITPTRANAIRALAAAVAENPNFLTQFASLDEAVQRLCQLPGIGEWTAQYIAMRALREPNAFPPNDAGLLRAMEKLGERVSSRVLLNISSCWQPWRAYAAMHLWMMDF